MQPELGQRLGSDGGTTVTENTIEALQPAEIAESAERIYQERYKEDYERSHSGEFVVIDITTGEAYLGSYPEDAMRLAEEAAPKGMHYLIKIGAPAAFRIGFIGTRNTHVTGNV